jgi:hypothetical protein
MQDDHSDEPGIISKRGRVYGLGSGALRIVSVVKGWPFVSITGGIQASVKGNDIDGNKMDGLDYLSE